MAQDNKSFVFVTIIILLISISIKTIIHAMFQSESLMDDSFLWIMIQFTCKILKLIIIKKPLHILN